MSSAIILSGGCLCGAVRYQITADKMDADYCHCGMCRKNSGAPVSAFVKVSRAAFRYTQGTPKVYASSAQAVREFCGACGSPLVFRQLTDDAEVEVTMGSLDQPGRVQPAAHYWVENQLPWLTIKDKWSRYRDMSDLGRLDDEEIV